MRGRRALGDNMSSNRFAIKTGSPPLSRRIAAPPTMSNTDKIPSRPIRCLFGRGLSPHSVTVRAAPQQIENTESLQAVFAPQRRPAFSDPREAFAARKLFLGSRAPRPRRIPLTSPGQTVSQAPRPRAFNAGGGWVET